MYKDFAYIYDELLYDVDFIKWADYIESIFRINDLNPNKILDVACGTGNVSIELAKRGYDILGIDLSDDMVKCSKKKAKLANINIEFARENMIFYESENKFDAVICLLDSVNYILKENELELFFNNVAKNLNNNGLFIFDINSSYKLKEIIGNNTFYEISDKINYLWTNSYNEMTRISEFDLNFFILEKDNLYRKYSEIHREKAYNVNEIKSKLELANLKDITVYEDLTLTCPKLNSERLFFVSRKY